EGCGRRVHARVATNPLDQPATRRYPELAGHDGVGGGRVKRAGQSDQTLEVGPRPGRLARDDLLRGAGQAPLGANTGVQRLSQQQIACRLARRERREARVLRKPHAWPYSPWFSSTRRKL